MNERIQIGHFTQKDWSVIFEIYKEGIDTGMATFETRLPTWGQWDASHFSSCRIKAMVKNSIAGWAALAPVSKREVYKGVAEVSIYITSKYRGLGIGTLLLSQLITESEQAGF